MLPNKVALFFIWKGGVGLKKNMKVRVAMLENHVPQARLAAELGCTQPTLCTAMSMFEFSNKEKDSIIRTIKRIAEEKGE